MIEGISVLRNIVEQEFKLNFSLCESFIDYEKAYGTVHEKILWIIMESYGIPLEN